ncbi:tyrosine-type recombinase/integrase [Streptomyces sp. NPDC051546]|uniref:tyrosine-type recombinase/integrase n=1 Tax=Streptomyces sp. NPDC051546 TaxID=3365655 RepID=UPI00378D2EA1
MAWHDLRIKAGHGAASVRNAMRGISAMAHYLDVEPMALPENAVQLTSDARMEREGKQLAPSTAMKYQGALVAWRLYLNTGQTIRQRPGPGLAKFVRDQDVLDWATSLSVAKNKADGTVRTYTATVQSVADFADCDARDLYRSDLEAYIEGAIVRAQRAGKDTIKNNYRSHICKAVRSFCTYMHENVMDFPDITHGIERGAKESAINTKAISEEMFFRILELAEEDAVSPDLEVAKLGRQIRALTKLMGFSGLRISEASRSSPSHLVTNMGNWRIKIPDAKCRHGVSDDELLVDDIVVEELTMNWSPNEVICPDWDPKTAGEKFTGWVIKKGIFTTPRALRVFYGSWLYNKTKDIMLVRDQLRHKSIETTQLYIRQVPDDARDRQVTSFGAEMMRAQGIKQARSRSSVTPLRVMNGGAS